MGLRYPTHANDYGNLLPHLEQHRDGNRNLEASQDIPSEIAALENHLENLRSRRAGLQQQLADFVDGTEEDQFTSDAAADAGGPDMAPEFTEDINNLEGLEVIEGIAVLDDERDSHLQGGLAPGNQDSSSNHRPATERATHSSFDRHYPTPRPLTTLLPSASSLSIPIPSSFSPSVSIHVSRRDVQVYLSSTVPFGPSVAAPPIVLERDVDTISRQFLIEIALLDPVDIRTLRDVGHPKALEAVNSYMTYRLRNGLFPFLERLSEAYERFIEALRDDFGADLMAFPPREVQSRFQWLVRIMDALSVEWLGEEVEENRMDWA